MPSLWEILALGFVLGLRHAVDPDHLVAVTTIIGEYKDPLHGLWIGVSWALGHTTTLALVGLALLLTGVHIPDRLSTAVDAMVGIMLVLLGLQTLWNLRLKMMAGPPEHHAREASMKPAEDHEGTARQSLISLHGVASGKSVKPFFRVKSYLVGMVHGLAGSAALMLVVLASIRSTWKGLSYMGSFGLGMVVSMGLVAICISLPFSASGRKPAINRAVLALAGTVSVVFGLVLIFQIAVANRTA